MSAPSKVISALHANWFLNAAGLFLSYGASIVIVRAMAPALYAEYAAVIAIIGLATFVFEAGGNSGLTRYLATAADLQARGTFYRRMQSRRWLAAGACAVALLALGPLYARTTQFATLAVHPWMFVLIAGIVAGTLTRLLAHYGLLALFEAKTALLLQQGFLVGRSFVLAVVTLLGGGLWPLVAVFLASTVLEAAVVHHRLWRLIGAERTPLPDGFVNRAQGFGLLSVFDKACAMLGSGTVLLLVLAPGRSPVTMAFLGLAVDLVGKLVSLTVMPMGNLVAPYLSQTGDAPEAQALAAARVAKLSSLLYSFSVGAGVLLLPWFVSVAYGGDYAGAVLFALLLLVPTAFENWIRGCCSPVLLRNGRYRELMRVNVVQAVVTLTVLVFVHRQPVEIAIFAVGAARSAVAALNLIAFGRLVPAGTFRVPLQGAAVGALGCAIAWAWGPLLPLPDVARVIVQVLIFTATFCLGLRSLICRDSDVATILRRLTGTRSKALGWLIPAVPSLE